VHWEGAIVCVSETGMVDEPSYTCSVFILKLGHDKLLLIGMMEFYLEVTGIVDEFEVTKTNHELLCLFIERRNHKDSNKHKILEGNKIMQSRFRQVLENCS
jgi:hypothetical protein